MVHEPFASRSFRFACDIVRLYTLLANDASVPRRLAWQLLDAGTSIGANIEESLGSPSRRDYSAKISIALKEARETEFWLRLFLATGTGPSSVLEPLRKEASELVAILTATRRRLNDG